MIPNDCICVGDFHRDRRVPQLGASNHLPEPRSSRLYVALEGYCSSDLRSFCSWSMEEVQVATAAGNAKVQQIATAGVGGGLKTQR